MNKAKMTFRFNHGHGLSGSKGRTEEEQPKVIQLQQEEYQVIDANSTSVWPPQPQSDDNNVHTYYSIPVQQSSVPVKDVPINSASFIDAQSLNPYTNDYGGWQSSFDTETLRVEKLIRESSSDSMSHSEADGSESMRVPDQRGPLRGVPNETLRDHQWYVPEETSYVRPNKDGSWIKVALSVVGAVGTGVAFGFLVLSMFSGDTQGTNETGANPITVSQQSPGTQQNPAVADKTGGGAVVPPVKAGGDKSASTEPVPSIAASAPVSATAAVSGNAAAAVNIPAKTFTFLQSGVFSTPQGANAAQVELSRKGLSAVSGTGDKYPVYVGMTLKREEAIVLAQQFQQKKIEVILKNVELPALSKIKWNGKSAETLPAYLAQGDKLLQLISPLVLPHLSETKSTPLDNAGLQSVKTAHQAWAGLASGAAEGLPEEGKSVLLKMNSAMNAAVISLDEYKKNPSASVLWQTQNAMMQYVLVQQEVRKAIAAV
jgi:stage II sporulation protein B